MRRRRVHWLRAALALSVLATATASLSFGETIKVTSSPAGANVEIDGALVGDTPATILLASGTHEITIKSTSKKDWSREIEVMKGSQVALYAVFVQSP
jgi:hypothetical protein